MSPFKTCQSVIGLAFIGVCQEQEGTGKAEAKSWKETWREVRRSKLRIALLENL